MKIIDCYNILVEAGIATATKLFDEGQTEIKELEYNSKNVAPGTLFFCKGKNFKNEYLLDAVDKGACCYVSENLIRGESAHKPSVILVNDIKKAMAVLSKEFYYPEDKLKIIGITGTKGKSTTLYMLKEIFSLYFDKVAFTSGIESDDGTGKKKSIITTPENVDLYKHMKNAVDNDIKHIIIEVSSQGLKYGRCEGIEFDTVALINISNDHISPNEHPDFEDYKKSKFKIFDNSKTGWINSADDYYEEIIKYTEDKCEIRTYGKKESDDLKLIKFEESPKTLKLWVNEGETYDISMGGQFNVLNALCAISIAKQYGAPTELINKALSNFFIPGRLELLMTDDEKIGVMIDYAHNAISHRNLYEHIKKNYPDRKIAVCFGCSGDKALNRRTETAEITSEYADEVYVVPDNPGSEDNSEIAKTIVGNMKSGPKLIKIMDNREEGIKEAFISLSKAKEKSMILVLGKDEGDYKPPRAKGERSSSEHAAIVKQITKYNKK